ncbi:MAG: DUF3071 domain-containing protein [Pseudonocardiales bacterium]|nr:DUF3071 domain-containing protein [Pseudonocardiales bacterium]
MRALRVAGLGVDGQAVILETATQRPGEQRERFILPADDTLRAALRGDLPCLEAIETKLESQMRPREIQARIRAGASVEEVAAAAGAPSERIESFAHAVLLERSHMAALARRAHPVHADGPDVRTLEKIVTEAFRQRGHDAGSETWNSATWNSATWDSWRGEDGTWVVALRWRAGRSDNQARWAFHPGAHGGTVTAIDDHATDLIDPQPAAPLRAVPDDAVPDDATPDDGGSHRPANPSRTSRAIVPSWEDVLLGVRSPRS